MFHSGQWTLLSYFEHHYLGVYTLYNMYSCHQTHRPVKINQKKIDLLNSFVKKQSLVMEADYEKSGKGK